jgi:hypothetical protein
MGFLAGAAASRILRKHLVMEGRHPRQGMIHWGCVSSKTEIARQQCGKNDHGPVKTRGSRHKAGAELAAAALSC